MVASFTGRVQNFHAASQAFSQHDGCWRAITTVIFCLCLKLTFQNLIHNVILDPESFFNDIQPCQTIVIPSERQQNFRQPSCLLDLTLDSGQFISDHTNRFGSIARKLYQKTFKLAQMKWNTLNRRVCEYRLPSCKQYFIRHIKH